MNNTFAKPQETKLNSYVVISNRSSSFKNKNMQHLKTIPELIIKLTFHLSVWIIEKFHDMTVYEQQIDELSKLPKGTLGREIADCLDENKLRLVPGYESHDLKHSLLNYKMTPVDEIRMQAFMIGNGNITIPSIAIFAYGFALLPYKWVQFAKDLNLGYNSKSIKEWEIKDYANNDLNQLRRSVILADKKDFNTEEMMNKLAYIGSILAMVAGGFGMVYCLPYLFSSVLEDLVGAGFPFVGGAILFSAGLISIAIKNKAKKERRTSYNNVYS